MQRKNIIITIIAVILMAALTFGGLLLVRRLTTQPAANTQATPVQTSQSVISALKDSITASTTLKGSSLNPLSSKQAQTMYVKDAGLAKYVQITSSNGALLSHDNGYNKQDLTNATNDLTRFFTDRGISTAEQSNDPTVLLSVSDRDRICQVKTLSVSVSGPVSQLQLQCVDKSSYNDQVAVLSQLTKLWTDASKTDYSQLSLETTTKDQYTIAQLFAMTSSSSAAHILLFAKTNDTWTYIGDASTGTSVEFNEKYVINQSVKDGLDNPKYGSLLHDVLFGTVQ